ncbi:ABC transporter permease [Paenibacillus sinopodophylli]|uniref:ABC transporter permease n=1 Tax=Paenibacillus sinopodophylli TaxID=1837342 RepID=UPI00110D0994|nr:ABC transporter permease [Paenibacillus sinopodophylli]
MFMFVIRRLLVSIMVVLASVTLVFFILNVLPGNPAEMMLGPNATPETLQNLNESLGLNKSLLVQYFDYMRGFLKGDLGESFITKKPVIDQLLAQLPATLSLAGASIAIAVILGMVLGVLSAVYQNKAIDYVVRMISLFSISMPTFWLGILLILIFSVHLQWLPAIGNGSLRQLILPACCLGIASAGSLSRLVRNSVLEVLNEQFVVTLRAKGLPEKLVLCKHVLRNALIPTVTMIGIVAGELLSGAVVTETVFSRQGIGRVVVEAIMQKDIPLVQAAILIAAIFYIIVNLLVDISYTYIDPRIRSKH